MPQIRKPRDVLAGVLHRHDGRDPSTSFATERQLHPLWRQRGWTILDELAIGPHDYLVLRRERAVVGPPTRLTPREDEALRLAVAGATNKEIAHAMGVSPSTVGVLLHRARRKLPRRPR